MRGRILATPVIVLSITAVGLAQTGDAGAPRSSQPSQCATADPCMTECRQGNGDACSRAYDILKELDGKAAEAVAAVNSACTLEQPVACIEFAKLMRLGITDRTGTLILGRDPRRATNIQRRGVALLSSGCESGTPRYCGILGDYYDDGNEAAGIRKDQTKAAELFRKACDGNDGYGCYSVGFSLKSADEAAAKPFFKRACAADSGPGCAEAGDTANACKLGVTASCDVLCNTGTWTACAGGGAESRGKAARKRSETDLPGLFAQCMDYRSKIEKLRMAGIQAGRAGNRKQADNATQKIKEIEPRWSETLERLNQGIELVTIDGAGERDEQKYITLMRRLKACSCEPTRSGRCR